jgi:hypothetical protein
MNILSPLVAGGSMKIRGWNDLEGANGVHLYRKAYPRWLNVWLRIPIIDRFAYPVAVNINEKLPESQKIEDRMGSSFSYDPSRKFRKRRVEYRHRKFDGR